MAIKRAQVSCERDCQMRQIANESSLPQLHTRVASREPSRAVRIGVPHLARMLVRYQKSNVCLAAGKVVRTAGIKLPRQPLKVERLRRVIRA